MVKSRPQQKNFKNRIKSVYIFFKIVYNQLANARYLGVAQFGSALEWGSRGRKFKSSHSDHMNNLLKSEPLR